MPVSNRTFVASLFIAICVGFMAVAAVAAEPDWSEFAFEKTVHVLTTDEDGDVRETKIWMVVIDGTPYIRTSQTSKWGDNAELNDEVALRIEETDYPLRATFIEEDDERARIVAVFEEKYGSNPFLNWIRGDVPRILRLDPR